MEKNLKQQQSKIIKIALFGPESTGKTTLAKQLAAHFETAWTPEFARDYLQEKWDKEKMTCAIEDMIPIAVGQITLENEGLLIANKFLFCDTNLMVTKVFSEMYYDFCDPILDKSAKQHKYDLVFLTDIDVPWQKDDLRDKPENRATTFEIFKDALIQNNKPFIILSGSSSERLQKAVTIIEQLEKANELGFTSVDFIQIHESGVNIYDIASQLDIFKKGIQKTTLQRPALINDGIIILSETNFSFYESLFDNKKRELKLLKFVPASGAASRMFKFLSEFINEFDIDKETINAYINRKNASSLSVFLLGLEKFPFYEATILELKKNFSNYKVWNDDLRDFYFIKTLLSSKYFDFANKPKGVLPFHKYNSHIATPVEEHLNESTFYATSNGVSYLHFTISQDHQEDFERIIKEVKPKIETKSASTINVNFSYQSKVTDTIAVNIKNQPFRDTDDKLVFRPGGHGALIQNLNDLDADIIFIKNIDNVIQNHMETIALYKKALAGILIDLQTQIFDFLKAIEENQIIATNIENIFDFVKEKLNIEVIGEVSKYTLENKIIYLKELLDRPIRVCGMVKNEGEPGGGPFWVSDKKGNLSLQIVESSQVDLENSKQLEILQSATHFNPVDLVCGIKNYKHEKFNLTEFIDEESGFIVQKNKNGKDLKAYELPGLWNGAMAKWITIFVEVPLVTFNPVKTVNDLLKPAHQTP